MVEAAPQARPEDHLGGIVCSSFVAEYHLGLTSALQHCQHNGAFRFLAAQVFIAFPVTAVTLDTNFAIAGLLPPCYHPGDHLVSLWTPWGTMGAAGRTRGGPKQDFY